MNTQAFQLIKNGAAAEAFQRNTINIPDPKEDEVQIEVEAFGLNYADVMARNGLYREAPPLPAVIGYEVVGKITAVGSEEHQHLLGRRVVGFTRFGGYAQHANTKAIAVAEVGEMDAGKALALATQYVTAYYMCMDLLHIHLGDTALVHAAAGGVGTALIQLLKMRGATVIAKTGSDEKRAYLEALGADHIVNYNTADYAEQIRQLLGDKRIDISFNPVAGSTFKTDSKLVGSGGKIVLFGASERSGKRFGFFSTLNFVWKMGFIIPVGLMMRSKAVIGVNMLKVADFKPHVLKRCLEGVVELVNAGKIDPQVGAEFPADQLPQAHDLLESGKSVGKIVVRW